jgi:hypothetical protein
LSKTCWVNISQNILRGESTRIRFFRAFYLRIYWLSLSRLIFYKFRSQGKRVGVGIFNLTRSFRALTSVNLNHPPTTKAPQRGTRCRRIDITTILVSQSLRLPSSPCHIAMRRLLASSSATGPIPIGDLIFETTGCLRDFW